MSKNSEFATTSKPAKPTPDFPLYAHASKRWAKKILGKTKFFGPRDDPGGALEKFNSEKDDLYAGRRPSPASDSTPAR